MDPLAAYTFRVFLGVMEFGFSKVSGLGREAETTVYQEGGINDRVHVLRAPAKTPGTLRMERGAYAGEFSPFIWRENDCSFPCGLRYALPKGCNCLESSIP